MAQPPGSETFASPMRAINGAITQKLARIFETSSYGAVVSMMVFAEMCRVWPWYSLSPGRLPDVMISTP